MRSDPFRGALRLFPMLVSATLLAACATPPRIIHVEGPGSWKAEPVPPAAMVARLEEAAEHYAAQGHQVARAGFFDIALPADAAENAAMHGHGLMLVTAVAHDGADLPPRLTYLAHDGRRTLLTQVATVGSDVPRGRVAEVLGPHRWDALFLVPLTLVRPDATVTIDFGTREGFGVGTFQGSPDVDASAFTGAPPEAAAVLALAAREFPGFVDEPR